MNVLNKSVILYAEMGCLGGVQTHVFHLSRLLKEKGARVTIVSFYRLHKNWNDLPGKGIKVVTTGLPFGSKPSYLKNLVAALSWPLRLLPRSYDVICCFGASGFFPFMRYFLSPQGLLIYNDVMAGLVSTEFSHKVIHKVDALLTMGNKASSNIKPFSLPSTPIRAIPHLTCIDLNLPPISTRSMQALKDRPFSIACFGNLVRSKNHDILIELWEELDTGPATLTFYGDGPDRARLSDLIDKSRLQGQVFLWGAYNVRKDLASLMAKTDLVVLPSKREGLPLVLIEAMAHGVPLVATDVGCVSELAEDNPDVLLVPPTREGIKQGIEEMVRRVRAGDISPQRLQQYYQERYSLQALGPKWVSALLDAENFWREL